MNVKGKITNLKGISLQSKSAFISLVNRFDHVFTTIDCSYETSIITRKE